MLNWFYILFVNNGTAMNLSSYILEQALRQLQLPKASIAQFQLAGKLSDVEGRGFPKELFQLSAPVIVRGLLNFAVLQMQRDWVYPFWVHKQLDPESDSYIPRAQNPLLINITHRNWTAVGTPNGFYEAIVDPRGLVTPLPREWSVDTWLVTSDQAFFPSRAASAEQSYEKNFPCLTTHIDFGEIELQLEHFAASTNHQVDVLFGKSSVVNKSKENRSGMICIAIRPFNPEGVAPVFSVEFKSPRIAHINTLPGLVFAETPDAIYCSSYAQGDLGYAIGQNPGKALTRPQSLSSKCDRGEAHAVALFRFNLNPGEERQVHYSVALSDDKNLGSRTKQSWRVSFDKRKSQERGKWEKEISSGAVVNFADSDLQALFDACRLSLLQFNDEDFISPGPFLYHHFWYRDAAVMLRALDVLGFHDRVRNVIDAFQSRLASDGFFRGPDGEWDSNGAVLWLIHQHLLLNPAHLWLKKEYGQIRKAAQWIVRKRQQSANGLMPASLSAEHLGTVDQYYWDSFWSLAGLQSIAHMASMLDLAPDAKYFQKDADAFEGKIVDSLKNVAQRFGEEFIPATPLRNFDESAIGSVSSIYPLGLFGGKLNAAANTAHKLRRQFVLDKGFLHPFVHSGYNPYLTLQLAHSLLKLGEIEEAWSVAETIFRQASPPFSFPEAIHPRTGGGTMGDGHHGWVAAEVILFLRSCLVTEEKGALILFRGGNGRLVRRGVDISLKKLPTEFGPFSCSLTFVSEGRAILDFENAFDQKRRPSSIEVYLPFEIKEVVASPDQNVLDIPRDGAMSAFRCSSETRRVFLKL